MPTAQSFENLFPILYFFLPSFTPRVVELSLHINKKAASHRDTASNIYVRIHSLRLRMLRGTMHRKTGCIHTSSFTTTTHITKVCIS